MDKPPPTEDAREEAQIAYWNDATAANWVALEERIDPVLAPLSTLALEAAAPEPGERALDIGSGCGGTVLELAGRVGPTGHVLGIDVSVPMSALARERIEAARLANADILVADATTYGFASGDRDLLFSRLGVMFFADPAAALTNLRRATRAGGRIEWIVWRALAEIPGSPCRCGRRCRCSHPLLSSIPWPLGRLHSPTPNVCSTCCAPLDGVIQRLCVMT
jgi:SAM-dependent methyltransferase